MFIGVFYQIILFCNVIHNKKTALSYLICKKNIFSLSPKKAQNLYKINQYHVIDSDNILQMKNTNDL